MKLFEYYQLHKDCNEIGTTSCNEKQSVESIVYITYSYNKSYGQIMKPMVVCVSK